MKKKILLPLEEKNSKWWIGSKKEEITWYTKKGDDIYLIPGSEFPEVKIDSKTKKRQKIRSNKSELKLMLFIAIGSFTGVALAMLVFYLIS
jgi:hypothetical protein